MIPQPPPGQAPIDPRGAFTPPPPPGGVGPFPPGSAPPAAGPWPGAVQQPQVGPAFQGPTGMPTPLPGVYGAPFGYPPSTGFPSSGGYPPMGPYPPFMPPPFPPRRRGGFFRTLFLTLLIVGLFISLIVNAALLVNSDGGRTQQSTILSGDPHETVAVVPLQGLIDDREAQRFDRLMTRADNDKNVKALVVRIDTPGGAVTASDEIYERIRKFKAKKDGIPVVISMGGMATSGGYYAACAGDYLFAEETTLTGNIGVLLPGFNFSRLMDKYGIQDQTIVSTGAFYKNAGSMFAPQTEKDRAYLQAIADSAFARFKSVVVTGRGSRLSGDIDAIADGRVYVEPEALKAGLVDEKGYLDEATKYAARQAHLSRPTVVKFQEVPSIFDFLGAESETRFPGPARGATGQATINGINVNIDAETLDRLASPRLMYLWRGG